MYKIALYLLFTLFFASCVDTPTEDESTTASNSSSMPSSVLTKGSCIINYDQIASKSDFAMCIDDLDETRCKKLGEDDDPNYSVNAFLIQEGCLEAGFLKDQVEYSESGTPIYILYTLYNQEDTSNSSLVGTQTIFPNVDEKALLQNKPATKIETISHNAIFSATPVESDRRIDVGSTVGGSFESGFLLFESVDNSAIGKALFIDGNFEGVIESVTPENGNYRVKVKNANSIEEA